VIVSWQSNVSELCLGNVMSLSAYTDKNKLRNHSWISLFNFMY